MHSFVCPIALTDDPGGGFVVACQGLPEVISQGEPCRRTRRRRGWHGQALAQMEVEAEMKNACLVVVMRSIVYTLFKHCRRSTP